jgi:hypothetical protein
MQYQRRERERENEGEREKNAIVFATVHGKRAKESRALIPINCSVHKT